MLSSRNIPPLLFLLTVLGMEWGGGVRVQVQGFPLLSTPRLHSHEDKIHICGARIWTELRTLCQGHFYNPHDEENSTNHDPPTVSVSSIVSTCCRQPCTLRHLYKFCSKEWRARVLHRTSLDQPIGTEPSIANDPAPFILDWMIYDTRTGRLVKELDPMWWNAMSQAPNLVDGTPRTVFTFRGSSEVTDIRRSTGRVEEETETEEPRVGELRNCHNRERHLTTSRRGCMKTGPPVDNSYVAINVANERAFLQGP